MTFINSCILNTPNNRHIGLNRCIYGHVDLLHIVIRQKMRIKVNSEQSVHLLNIEICIYIIHLHCFVRANSKRLSSYTHVHNLYWVQLNTIQYKCFSFYASVFVHNEE